MFFRKILDRICGFFNPILISLSPNVEKDDLLLAFKTLFFPVSKVGPWKLEQKFKEYLGVEHAFAFNSGRGSLFAILKALDFESDSEILLQGFTCNAAVNPILWNGLKSVFVDIKEQTLNIDPQDLERKITSQSKAVIVQHTFGIPAQIEEIQRICKEYNLILIEDCAHSLGVEKVGLPTQASCLPCLAGRQAAGTAAKVGTFGKAAFFSLGRDKVISSVWGGIAVTDDPQLAKKIRRFQWSLDSPSKIWCLKQLLHPILTKTLVIPFYNFFKLGRAFLIAFQKLGILSKSVQKIERKGGKPAFLPQKMGPALAALGLHQFQKLERFNSHRQRIAALYDRKLGTSDVGWMSDVQPAQDRVFMRYPVLIEKDTDQLLMEARKYGIFLDDGWRKTPIVPKDTDLSKMGYTLGDCPTAERVAQKIVNLPTHINVSKSDARRIIRFLKTYEKIGQENSTSSSD